MVSLAIYLFGSPRVLRDGMPVSFARRKSLALLAYLATNPGPHSRDALLTLFWPELDTSAARAGLRRQLVELRHAIGAPWLATEGSMLALRDQPGLSIDVRDFSAHLAAVAAHADSPALACDDCLAHLTAAAELHTADFLAHFAMSGAAEFELWQTAQAEALRLSLAEALQTLANSLAARRDYAQALSHARRWLALDPLAEPAVRCLMRLHAAIGDRHAALKHFEECRQLLADELGLAPDSETTALHAQIRAGAITSQPSPAALQTPMRRHPEPAFTLPPDATPFLGRSAELAMVSERLADPACHLLTLHGPGGIGKTRLALQAARGAAPAFAHGACFVDLAPIASADMLAPTILRALGVLGSAPSGPDRQLLDFLCDREVLLVLDNFEHLLASPEPECQDGSDLVAQIVGSAPRVKLLITSRTRLNLPAEWLVPLQGMASPSEDDLGSLSERRAATQSPDEPDVIPGQQADDGGQSPTATLQGYSATALFLACLRRQQPTFLPSVADAHHIAQICRLLEGMPLAIELAAGWARAMALEEIASRLEQGLELLVSRMRGVPARQRSMTATFDYSWQLLAPHERGLLRRLSVFRGGFSREAAEQVAGAAIGDLADLADASWLSVGPEGRYAVHELARQYWAERLEAEHLAESGESAEQVRGWHAGYYHALLARQWASFFQRPGSIAEIAPDWVNLVAAWNWALAQADLELVYGLSMGLAVLGDRLGAGPEVARLLEVGVERLRSAQPTALDDERARQRLTVVALLLTLRAERLWNLAQLDGQEACLREAASWLDRSGAAAQSVEVRWLHRSMLALSRLGRGVDLARQFRELQAEAQSKAFRMWPYGPGSATMRLLELQWDQAIIMRAQGNYAEARRLAERGISLAQELGSELGRGYNLRVLALMLSDMGQYPAAAQAAQESVRIGVSFGDTLITVMGLAAVGRAQFGLRRDDLARATWQRGLALARRAGLTNWADHCRIGLGDIEMGRGDLTAARRLYEASCVSSNPSQALTSSASLAALGALVCLGRIALLEGQPGEALRVLRQVLKTLAGWAPLTAEALAYAAEALLSEGQPACCGEICGFLAGWQGTPYRVGQLVEALLPALAARLPADDLAACMKQGRTLSLDEMVTQVTGAD